METIIYRQTFGTNLIEDHFFYLNIVQLPLSIESLKMAVLWPEIENDKSKKPLRKKQGVIECMLDLFSEKHTHIETGFRKRSFIWTTHAWFTSVTIFNKKETQKHNINHSFYYCDFAKGLLIDVAENKKITINENGRTRNYFIITKINRTFYFY